MLKWEEDCESGVDLPIDNSYESEVEVADALKVEGVRKRFLKPGSKISLLTNISFLLFCATNNTYSCNTYGPIIAV